jgi:hypothetical protein
MLALLAKRFAFLAFALLDRHTAIKAATQRQDLRTVT